MGYKPIGNYGNGFKSGTMRLGKDALVFTKHCHTMSVGFLSQSFLETISASDVLIPMLTWDPDFSTLPFSILFSFPPPPTKIS